MQKDKLNATDIAGLIADQSSVSKRGVEDFLKALVSTIEDGLLANDVVKIKGLGAFKLQWNEPRKSVNISTGDEIVIDGYYKVVFAPESELKDLVNLPYAHLEATLLSADDESMPPDPENDYLPDSAPEPMRILSEQASEIKSILSEINSLGKKPEAVSAGISAPKEEVESPEESKVEQKKVVFVEAPEQPKPKASSAVATQEVNDPISVEVSADVLAEDPPSVEPLQAVQVPRKPAKSRGMAVVLFVFIGIGIGVAVTYLLHYMNWLPESALLYKFPDTEMDDVAWVEAQDAIADEEEEMYADPVDEFIEPSDGGVAQEEETFMAAEEVSRVRTEAVRPVQPVSQVDFKTVASMPRVYDEFIATEEVIPGSRLARIAERHYGVREFWVYIYEANIDLFESPDYVAPGTTLRIPKLHPLLGDPKSADAMAFAKKLHDQYINK